MIILLMIMQLDRLTGRQATQAPSNKKEYSLVLFQLI